MKALVVDDSRVARLVLVGVLTHDCGFEDTVEAEDGVEAVEAINDGDFDLVLLDWNMPNLKGIDALRQIRERGIRTPVMMVTSENERDRIVEAVEAGANGYVIKPYSAKTVAERIADTLERSAGKGKHSGPRRALVAEDSSVVRKLLVGLLTDRCEFDEVVQVVDGAEAIAAVDAGSFDVILLDWNMPKVEGIDALRHIRKKDPCTPVIMVTGETDGERVIEAFDAGASNYIIKPFEAAAVAEKIRQVMQIYA